MPDPKTPIQVALVSTAAAGEPGSMRAYTATLQAALAAHAPDISTRLIELDPKPASHAMHRRLQTALMPLHAWRQRRPAPDLWHVLDGSRAYLTSALRNAPAVVTAHDLIPWLQSQRRFAAAPKTGAAAHWLWGRNGAAMHGAARLICDSANTAQDAQRAFAIDAARCTVVPLPLRSALQASASEEADVAQRAQGTVLHVGNNGFYKNRTQVLRIFARLPTALATQLVMIGAPPTAELREQATQLGIDARLQWVADSDDATLAGWYRRASVLVFPSLYEGYGWPVLEAMAFGLPVVCSDRGSLPEVAGDAATVVSIDSDEVFAAAVERVLRENEVAEAMRARGLARAAEFSAARFAREMQAVYLQAVTTHRGEAG